MAIEILVIYGLVPNLNLTCASECHFQTTKKRYYKVPDLIYILSEFDLFRVNQTIEISFSTSHNSNGQLQFLKSIGKSHAIIV